jgi:hypothetical protein
MTDPILITEEANPPISPRTPYVLAASVITVAAIAGVVIVLTVRPDKDNALLVTQILGFAATTLASTLAYMRSTETREVVNSRMDEFKRSLQAASAVAQAQARAEGKAEGRAAADARTDTLAKGPTL